MASWWSEETKAWWNKDVTMLRSDPVLESVKAWCKRKGFPKPRYYYWKNLPAYCLITMSNLAWKEYDIYNR